MVVQPLLAVEQAKRIGKVEMDIIPSGYTSSLIGVFSAPEQVTPSDLTVLESGQATGSMMYIRADLSSVPSNIDEIMTSLSEALTDAGIRSWLVQPAVADTDYPCFYITWVNEGKGDVLANQWQAFLGSSLGTALIAIIIGMFAFALVPGFAELIETLMAFGIMMVMMYFMTQMMAGISPALKPVAEWERNLVRRAKAGIPEAVSEVRSLADKGIGWAKRTWEEIKGK